MFDLPFDLPSGWNVKTVEQLIEDGIIEKPLDGNHGGTHPKASDYIGEGVPFVMASDLDAGMVDLENCKYISEAQASKLRKGFSKVGDVLLSHKATIGRTAIVQDIEHDYIMLTPQVTYYRVKDATKLNNVYLKAYFDSTFFQTILGLWAGAGSTRAYLGITGQLKLPVIVPPIESQYSIAHQVKALDNKIQINRQTNQTLEDIAQAIFKSWFVDFEPTKAKIGAKESGQDPELAAMAAISGKPVTELELLTSEKYQELKTTAALFPETLVDSELGEIPEGWEVGTLEDFIELAYGKALKKTDRINGEYPVYGSGGITGTHNKALVSGPGIIVGRKGTVGSLYWEDESFFPIDTVFYVKCKNDMKLVYSYYLLQTLGLEDMNTDAAVPGLNRNNAYRLEVINPQKELIIKFSELADVYRNKLSANKQEIFLLEKLRNSLLPKLLSGELTI